MNVLRFPRFAARTAIVLLCVFAAGLALVPQALRIAGLQRATWFSLITSDGSTPDVKLIADTERGRLELPMMWDPSASADVAYIDPGGMQVRLVAAAMDGHAVSLFSLKPDLRWKVGGGAPSPEAKTLPFVVTQAGLLGLPASPLALELTLQSDLPGSAAVEWRNFSRRIEFHSRQPVKILLQGQRTGWALLPPEIIRSLALAVPDEHAWSRIGSFALHAGSATPLVAGSACAPTGTAPYPCMLEYSDFAPLNAVEWRTWSMVFGVIVLCGLGAAGLLLLAVRLCSWIDARYEARDSACGAFLNRALGNWNCAGLTLLVGGIGLTFHAAVLLFVPMAYTSGSTDSLLYYGSGRAMALGEGLAAVPSMRTPGYPMLIELTIRLFGDQVLVIGALQHLALAAVGPAAVWLFYRYLGPAYSLLAGLLAGLAPLLANTANVLWAEALQASCMTIGAILVALVLRSPRRDIPRSIAGGILIGTACLMRPAAELLLVLVPTGFALLWWVQRDWARSWRGLAANFAALVLSALIVVAPWLKEMYEREGTIGRLAIYSHEMDRTHVLRATSLHLLGWFNNTIFQGRMFPGMDIVAPFRAYARGNSVYSGFIFQLPGYLWMDDRFPGEATRESVRHAPREFWDNVKFSLNYHVFLKMLPQYSYLAQSDIVGWFMAYEVARARQPDAPLEAGLSGQINEDMLHPGRYPAQDRMRRLEQLVGAMIDRTPPLDLSYADAALSPARVAAWAWPAMVLLALSSFVVLLIFRPLRPLLVPWMLVAMTIFYLSLMGWANERYMVVIEPLVYVLAVLVPFSLACLRLRKRPGPAATGAA